MQGIFGGPCRDRTYDQEIKSLLLDQLSKRPLFDCRKSPAALSAGITPSAAGKRRGFCRHASDLGWTMGLEPTTTGITTRGSTN